MCEHFPVKDLKRCNGMRLPWRKLAHRCHEILRCLIFDRNLNPIRLVGQASTDPNNAVA